MARDINLNKIDWTVDDELDELVDILKHDNSNKKSMKKFDDGTIVKEQDLKKPNK